LPFGALDQQFSQTNLFRAMGLQENSFSPSQLQVLFGLLQTQVGILKRHEKRTTRKPLILLDPRFQHLDGCFQDLDLIADFAKAQWIVDSFKESQLQASNFQVLRSNRGQGSIVGDRGCGAVRREER
jgi:hypothetical protein